VNERTGHRAGPDPCFFRNWFAPIPNRVPVIDSGDAGAIFIN
jgi:hypothetical protein